MNKLPISDKLKIIKSQRWFSFVLRSFQNWKVRVLFFLILFVFGICVYMFCGVPCANLAETPFCFKFIYSFHETIHSFFPSFGGITGEIGDEVCKGHVSWDGWKYYFTFHSLCVLYVVMLMFSLFGREIVNSMRIFFCKKKKKVVIWGFSEKGLLLALDLLCNKKCKSVVFYLDEDTLKDEERKKIIDRLDACFCSWRDVSFTNFKEGVESQRYFFISESGRENIVNAKRLLMQFKKDIKESCATFYIRIENASEEVFYDWLDGDIRNYANIVLFKESSISSSLLLEELVQSNHHSVVYKGDKTCLKPFKMLLLGLGHNGECALGDVVENVQRIGCSVSVDVVEQDVRKWLKYESAHHDFVREYNVNRIDVDFGVNSVDFYRWINASSDGANMARLLTYDIVLICLGDDNLALTTMAEIKKAYREISGELPPKERFFIQLDDYEHALFASNKEKLNLGFTPYGSLVEIYSCKLLGDDIVERLAKLINWVYCEGNSNFSSVDCAATLEKCDDLWSRAAFFDQQSSRASARGLVRQWKRMGYEVSIGESKTEEVLSLTLTQDELAREEHIRWMVFHYARGVRPWCLKSTVVDNKVLVSDNLGIIDKITSIKANQRRTFNAHAALVPYDDLPSVDLALDILKSKEIGHGDFYVDSLDCYMGEDKMSLVRSSSCLQANDCCINNLLVNSAVLFKVGLVLNKTEKGTKNEL